MQIDKSKIIMIVTIRNQHFTNHWNPLEVIEATHVHIYLIILILNVSLRVNGLLFQIDSVHIF